MNSKEYCFIFHKLYMIALTPRLCYKKLLVACSKKRNFFQVLHQFPANIRLDEDMKTPLVFVFKRRLYQDEYTWPNHSSSEDAFKTYSKLLGQDQYIRLGHTSSKRLQDVFKTSYQDVFKTSCQDVFKMFLRPFQDVLPRRLQNVFKTFSRRLAKMPSRHWRIIRLICLPTILSKVFRTK